MTAVVESPVVGEARTYKVPVNRFEVSLRLGWRLSDEEVDRVAEEFRTISIDVTQEIVFGSRFLTPKRRKGMSDEERVEQRRDIDQANADRTYKLYSFLRRFFSEETSTLLTKEVKTAVTGIVLLHCPNDQHFTLIPEREAYVSSD